MLGDRLSMGDDGRLCFPSPACENGGRRGEATALLSARGHLRERREQVKGQ